MFSKIRNYPKRLESFARGTGPTGIIKHPMPPLSETVYNQTSYDSYIRYRGDKYDINERKPKWNELEGNWLVKFWYWVPNWILVPVTYFIGLFSGKIAEGVSLLFQQLNRL